LPEAAATVLNALLIAPAAIVVCTAVTFATLVLFDAADTTLGPFAAEDFTTAPAISKQLSMST
jgi:hypothetical protein